MTRVRSALSDSHTTELADVSARERCAALRAHFSAAKTKNRIIEIATLYRSSASPRAIHHQIERSSHVPYY
jgi:hypothetical protein